MRRLVFIFLLLPLAVLGQVRVVTNVTHLLTLQPSPSQPWTDVDGYERPGDWGPPKRFRWDGESTLPTNAIILAAPGKPTGRYIHEWDGDARAFGIVRTNDTSSATMSNNVAAWRAMFYHATANGQADHSEIILPRGIYYFNDTLYCYGSQWDNPGSNFYTGRIKLRGPGMESAYLNFDGTTNNGLVVVGGRSEISGFSIGSTAARTASTNLLTSGGTGVGLLYIQVGAHSAHHDIENVVTRDHPGNGAMFWGGWELMCAENLLSQNNKGCGIVIAQQGTNIPTFQNLFLNCRAVGNANGGWALTNAFNTTLINCEAINNVNGPQILNSGRNTLIIAADVENQDKKPAALPPITTNTVVISGFQTFQVPGFDFAGYGVMSNMFLIVSNTAFNDRAWRITSVATDTISCSSQWGSSFAESPTSNVTLMFSGANVGLWDRFSTGTRVLGGYWGTLAVGMVFERAMNPIVDEPYFPNSLLTGWSGSEEIIIMGSVTNGAFHFRGSQESGWNARYRNRSDPTANNNIWYGPNPIQMTLGSPTEEQGGIVIQGGVGGESILTLYRPQSPIDRKIGFAVSEGGDGGVLIVRDVTDNRPIVNFQASLTMPSVRIGADSFGTPRTFTNVAVTPGRWASDVTNNASGQHLTLLGGSGTGAGTRGLVKVAVFMTNSVLDDAQTQIRDIAGFSRTGLILTDGYGFADPATTYLIGPDDFQTNQIFEVRSTNKMSMPFPILSTAQRNTIGGTNDGFIFNSTLNRVEMRRESTNYGIPRMLQFTGAIDFPSVAPNNYQVGTIAAPGATTADVITVRANLNSTLVYQASVMTNDTIVIRAYNIGTVAVDPNNANYPCWVLKP